MMEEQRYEEEPEVLKQVRRGWCLGPESFRQELLEEIAAKATIHHYGEERRESAEVKAQRILAEEPKKVKIARRLRKETMMTMAWIAKETGMGSESNLRKQLSKQTR
jgi:transcriptional regulator GlxA family with amidase domain